MRHHGRRAAAPLAPWTPELRRRARPARAARTARAANRPEPTPFLTRRVADVTLYPYSTCGKLFFKVGGEPFWGTAFVVARRGVFTAAHNLLDEQGRPTEDVEFLLQYEDGRSAGTWAPDPALVHVPPEWQPPYSGTFDFATFVTTTDLPIEQCGALAFQASQGLPQQLAVTALGYPFLDGSSEAMWECESAGSWSIVLDMLSSNFTDGAGGGPWVASLAGQMKAVGSTAQAFEEDELLTSPPFNDEVHQYINLVSGP